MRLTVTITLAACYSVEELSTLARKLTRLLSGSGKKAHDSGKFHARVEVAIRWLVVGGQW